MPQTQPNEQALPETGELEQTIARAQRVLWESQRLDGSWDSPGQIGPWVTAQAMVTLNHLGELPVEDLQDSARWLRAQQRADGGFVLQPYARQGEMGATACAWAAFHVAAKTLPEYAGPRDAAKAWVERQGGLPRVIDRMAEGDFAAVFLCLAGLQDAKGLPVPNTLAMLAPPLVSLLQRRFHAGVIMGALQLEVTLRRLRGEWGPHGTEKGWLGRARCEALFRESFEFQNQNGSWNDSVGMTLFVLPALWAAGLTTADPRMARAVAWVKGQGVKGVHGLTWDGFGAEVWSTAFNARALLATGFGPSDPEVKRALDWIVSAQLDIPMPRPNNRKPGAVRTGGWAFQRTNHTMVDCDDAGVCLSALGQALSWEGDGAADAASRQRYQRSIEEGKAWLFDMQNPDGGWSAFVWGLPGKPRGPVLMKTPRVPLDDPFAMVKVLINPPITTGDPSTEDLTSRVLHGLGAVGLTVADPRIFRAVDFLKAQQCDDGSFWGRWVVNYLSATAFVLMGLRAVKVDLREPWVRRAVDFLESRQNADGGWGETEESYSRPNLAGRGPSMPPLTGLVLQGLIEAGEGDGDAVKRGVAYLVREQRPDGSWRNNRYLHTNIPPETFYIYEEATRFYPTEALGRYLEHLRHPFRLPTPRWSDGLLDAMRQSADPVADAVVEGIFQKGQLAAVNEVLGQLFRSTEPLPPGLPPEVAQYFEDTQALPSWTDVAKLQTAQKLFARAGWETAAALFCSSLPQAYAAAKGARVLTQTQGMTRHVHQRIFETAQFLFDVLDEGSLDHEGRGVRTAQKVRLMHAAIRHLLLTRTDAAWDSLEYGVPVNQEDLAGTLMTFSVVTLEAFEPLGVDVSAQEAEAWLHLWNVVGHFLGIREELLPKDVSDGQALFEVIRYRHWMPSEEGRTLIRPLMEMMQHYFPGEFMDGMPVALVRHLAGDHCANLLGLPPADWTGLVLDATEKLEKLIDPAGKDRLTRFFAGATRMIMRGIVTAEREGKRAKFRIPKALQETVDPNA